MLVVVGRGVKRYGEPREEHTEPSPANWVYAAGGAAYVIETSDPVHWNGPRLIASPADPLGLEAGSIEARIVAKGWAKISTPDHESMSAVYVPWEECTVIPDAPPPECDPLLRRCVEDPHPGDVPEEYLHEIGGRVCQDARKRRIRYAWTA